MAAVLVIAGLAYFFGGLFITNSDDSLVDGLSVVSYGCNQRKMQRGEMIGVSWHVRIKNNSSKRTSRLFVVFDGLDHNGEQLWSSNDFTNLGPGEELTVTGESFTEQRLYALTSQIGITFSLAGGKRYYTFPLRETPSVTDSPDAALIAPVFGDDVNLATEAAKKFMVGTWTYTGKEWNVAGYSFWMKWEVFSDGTMNEHTVPASADSWEEPEKKNWEILTGKFADSGKRYYAFHIKGQAVHSLILEDGNVYCRMPDGDLLMKRGDVSPFSK